MSQLPPVNPANVPQKSKAERTRIPMSVPLQKLAVPDIAGYHLHWFLDSNIARAQQGWYEFVQWDEVDPNQVNVATNKEISGNADLGSRVMIIAGEGVGGKTNHLVLMKIKEEYYREDQKIHEDRNMEVLKALRHKKAIHTGGESQEDKDSRYVRSSEFTTHTKTTRRP